ncbi:hypothetical protein SCATT_19690 [Streptantibioticus cattleyicolor NRRL 8057 = DSM 46488]|uniref:Uncharacterized protein n=1 Tax=Streptantibioticus cattleyicolor (strain ATCC 35852 / DSM 46488 / JCM 4925 / NBRC 14057 / NRRL 8057) TaxID=1003195 RepID=G8WWD3_STREN|nr:hypothetical protein SCATT_19690 [Streptantibioticus cattleyicolor NRRL 8057 = DSM 46488]
MRLLHPHLPGVPRTVPGRARLARGEGVRAARAVSGCARLVRGEGIRVARDVLGCAWVRGVRCLVVGGADHVTPGRPGSVPAGGVGTVPSHVLRCHARTPFLQTSCGGPCGAACNRTPKLPYPLALAVTHLPPRVPPVPVSSWLASRMFPPAHPWLCSYSAGCALSSLVSGGPPG